jgi:alpha-ketoglutarate-dependent taurine dioxygenase
VQIISFKVMVDAIDVCWEDGNTSSFPLIWLRDNDPGELHPDTRERIFDLTRVELDISPVHHSLENNSLLLHWPGRTEASTYSARWLYNSRPGVARNDPAELDKQLWTPLTLEQLPRFSASACQNDPEKLCEALRHLKRSGVMIVESLATDELAGARFGDLVGFKRQSNFGIGFEVINKVEPNNLAYTALPLPLHTDLPNQEAIPGYQFLHCCQNTVTGGASLFADGFRICADFQRESPEQFRLLTEVSLPWRFHDVENDIRYRRPIIGLGTNGTVQTLAFNAHIADVPDLTSSELPDFYAAYRAFMLRIRSAQYSLSYTLQPGEMAVFDNHRILHGRDGFVPTSGQRRLRGFYIDHNEVDSRIRVLSR